MALRRLVLAVLLCVGGCAGEGARSSQARQPDAEPISAATEFRSNHSDDARRVTGETVSAALALRPVVLAAFHADTVWAIPQRTDPDSARVVWYARATAGRVLRWRSPALWRYLVPQVRLLMVNRDSAPDAFLTTAYENVISGTLLLAEGDSAHEVYSPHTNLCRVPELRDVDGDSLTDIVEYVPGVVPYSECTWGPYECQRRFQTEWVEFWLQRDGAFIRDNSAVSGSYADLARKYRQAAATLRGAISRGASAVPQGCTGHSPLAFDSLARLAQRRAGS